MAPSSAEYFRKRRETIGQFSVSCPRDKLEALTERLKAKGQTKTDWLAEKIEEELAEKLDT